MTLTHHGLDHIYFKAHDTLQVQAELWKLGFHTTSRDVSPAGDVTIVSAVFRDSWISVGANARPEQDAQWMSMFRFGATPVVLLRTNDNPTFMQTLRSLGSTPPIDIMTYDRPTTTPNGPATLQFEMSTAMCGPIPAPVIITGIRQLTRELLFRPDLVSQPNGVTDLDAFIIEMPEVAPAREGLEKLFGAAAVKMQKAQAVINLGNAQLILAEPDALRTRYGAFYEPGNTTFARFRLADQGPLEARLSGAGVTFTRLQHPTSLALIVESLNRCVFEFVES